MPDDNSYKTEIVRNLFGAKVQLGRVKADFSCANGSYPGRMYVCDNGICFYSTLFGFERKIYFLYESILNIRMIRTSGIVISGYFTKKDGQVIQKDHVFKSIAKRNTVFQILQEYLNEDESGVEDDLAVDESSDTIDDPTQSFDRYNPRAFDLRSSVAVKVDTRGSTWQSKSESDIMSPKVNEVASPKTNVKRSQSLQASAEPTAESKVNTPEDPKEVSTIATSGDASSNANDLSEVPLFDGTNKTDVTTAKPTEVSEAWNKFKSSSENDFELTAVKNAELPAFTLDSFYDEFLDDNVAKSISFYHETQNDIINETTPWDVSDDGFHSFRMINLDHPVPGYGKANTTKFQHCRFFDDLGLTIDSYVTSKGLPAVDCFRIEERVFIEAKPDGGLSMTAFYRTVWFKGSFLKKIADKSAKDATVKFYEGYVNMINESDSSGLPSVIVDLQKDQKIELEQSNRTQTLLYFSMGVMALLCASLLFVTLRVSKMQIEMTDMLSEIESLRTMIADTDSNWNKICPDLNTVANVTKTIEHLVIEEENT